MSPALTAWQVPRFEPPLALWPLRTSQENFPVWVGLLPPSPRWICTFSYLIDWSRSLQEGSYLEGLIFHFVPNLKGFHGAWDVCQIVTQMGL